jgi:AraC family L-rhamnose operon regulatory protein RhaS
MSKSFYNFFTIFIVNLFALCYNIIVKIYLEIAKGKIMRDFNTDELLQDLKELDLDTSKSTVTEENDDGIYTYTQSDYINKGKLVRIYYHDIEEFGDINEHTHDFYELNVVIKGNGRHFIGNFGYFIGGGEVFVIPPKIAHSYEFSGTAKIFHILFTDEFFKKYGELLKNMPGYNMLFNVDPTLRLNNRGDAILTLASDKKVYVYNLIESFFNKRLKESHDVEEELDVVKLLSVLMTQTICHKPENELVLTGAVKALDYITENYGEKITLELLSEISDLSRSAFIVSFKKLTGQPPLKYLADYRLSKAKELLSTTNQKITEIALNCGFFDNAHFTKEFKKTYGVTPKAYKDNL